MKDYSIYRLKTKERLACFGVTVVLTFFISWLFYQSIYGMALSIVIFPGIFKIYKKEKIEKQKEELLYQFKESIQIMAGALQAGYSPENALIETQKDMIQLFPENSDMCRELHFMNQQISLNITLEKLFIDLAVRSHVEDIISFSQVFTFAKRSGGNFNKIWKESANRIGEKVEIYQEIQVVMAAKKLEQNIMNVVPMIILLFVDVSSPGFLSIMYENVLGRVIMTFCLLVYVGAYFLARKIVDIKI